MLKRGRRVDKVTRQPLLRLSSILYPVQTHGVCFKYLPRLLSSCMVTVETEVFEETYMEVLVFSSHSSVGWCGASYFSMNTQWLVCIMT